MPILLQRPLVVLALKELEFDAGVLESLYSAFIQPLLLNLFIPPLLLLFSF